MAWTSPMTAVANQKWTATQFNAHVRDNLLETEAAVVSSSGQFVLSDGVNSLTTRTVNSAASSTTGTTSSTSYTSSLSGASSLSVSSVTTGTAALVYVGARMSNSVNNAATYIGVAISGATSVAADDDRAAYIDSLTANNLMSAGVWELYTGLTPGSHTFTAQYHVSSGTGTYGVRNMIVIAL